MSAKKIIIANWKLQRTFSESLVWCDQHRDDLLDLTGRAEIVICPDVVTIAALAASLKGTGISVGAQGASPYVAGAYTSAISVRSLREAGCRYALIGHHEQYRDSLWTPSDYALSCALALKEGLAVVFFLGSSLGGSLCYNMAIDRHDALNQIDWLCDQCEMHGLTEEDLSRLYFAYEPAQAIGSGELALLPIIEESLSWIKEAIKSRPLLSRTGLIYGGGVTSENCADLKGIRDLSGLLLGSSSLDMQSFKKIVYSFT